LRIRDACAANPCPRGQIAVILGGMNNAGMVSCRHFERSREISPGDHGRGTHRRITTAPTPSGGLFRATREGSPREAQSANGRHDLRKDLGLTA
jgi:hypothetical protein